MQVETWPLSRIHAYPKNARKIPQSAIDKVALSLRTYGWRQPMVVEPDGTLIVGHVRLLGALQNGWTEGPVNVATDLTPEQVKAYRLMDNRSHDEARWDWELVGLELGELKALNFDLATTGFDMGQRPEYAKDVEPQVDKAEALQRIWKTEIGQHWKIGRHSLTISDSLTADVEPCDGICTDPPFDMSGAEVGNIMRRFSSVAVVMCSDRLYAELASAWKLGVTLVWRRVRPRSFPTKHQPVMFHALIGVFSANAEKTAWARPHPQFGSVFECVKEFEDSKSGHGKASAPFEEMLRGFNWETVCDPFGGTGATVLACEAQDRRCITLEKDPAIAAVALDRCQRAGLQCELVGRDVRDIDATPNGSRPRSQSKAASRSVVPSPA